MEKLPMCRICLVKNVRMFVVVNKNWQQLYEKLTDFPFVTEDSRPILVCFFCCAKLNQCYRLLQQCLEAEKLFAQMMNEDYESNPLINQDHLQLFGGFIKSPTENISIIDVIQTENIALKEELPAVCEGLDDVIEPKEEHQSDELEPDNYNKSCLDVADIKPHYSESDLEDDVPLMEFKTEVKEEQEESENKQRASETTKLEPDSSDNSCLDVADIKPHHSESDSEDDVPLMKFEVEEEQDVSENKQRASEATRTTVTKKPKLEDAITAEQTREEKSDSKVIRITQKCTSKLGTYFIEPDECDQRSSNPVKKIVQKPYKCDVCERSFSKNFNLINHIRKHTGEKPFECDVCQRRFSEKRFLTSHKRIHTGDEPYKCDFCQRSFSEKSALRQHIRIHTGEKPFKCAICQISFPRRYPLICHIRRYTPREKRSKYGKHLNMEYGRMVGWKVEGQNVQPVFAPMTKNKI